MKIRKVTVIALMALFGLAFTACQEEEIIPSTNNVLNTEGNNDGHDLGPEDD
ncbi:hypothetical protein JMN32_06190 [Fulvivirga sp. 29W222]|uniref:Uncharacterized protein n=1 Tax=Fulvivirga marina TaxID=2494733 RepID=A0A937FVR4_9BACT|nr:hypothetical protein [Fulvivirga marina]MBL6445888.1 hypothetical protein [Fulvivirga marina]